MKINLDKYYTDTSLAKYCIDKTYQVLSNELITEIIEPSAGNGAFSLQLKECISYDIEPEHHSIIKADYLSLVIPYLKGRLFIGNPPFGDRFALGKAFYLKAIHEADFISFILPISQYKNSNFLFHFDLIYSEDLGKLNYSNREVHCCLNIYKRPIAHTLNLKPKYKFKDLQLVEHRRTAKEIFESKADLRICSYGASLGKEVEYPNQYVKETLFFIHNKHKKEEILSLIRAVNFKDLYKMTASPNLLMWQIYEFLKSNMALE